MIEQKHDVFDWSTIKFSFIYLPGILNIKDTFLVQ